MAAGMVADRDIPPRELLRRSDLGLRWHHDSSRREDVGFAPHLADLFGCGLVHRPMAGAGSVGPYALVAAALLVGFEGAGLQIGNLARRIKELFRAQRRSALELVVQLFVMEIAVRVCDPLLKPTVRLNDEFGHVMPLRVQVVRSPAVSDRWLFQPDTGTHGLLQE